jgi:CBS-domain-containing membrane protein
MGLIAYFLLDRTASRKPIGEWVTPVTARPGLAGSIPLLGRAERRAARPESLQVVLGFLVSALLAAVACAVIMHRSRRAEFTLRPIGGSALRLLLICVALRAGVDGAHLHQHCPGVPLRPDGAPGGHRRCVPAQAGAVVGAELVARWAAVRRSDYLRAARYLLLALAISMLPLLLMRPRRSGVVPRRDTQRSSALRMAAFTGNT